MSVDRLLVVGTMGGGGIHRYVETQAEHLSEHLDVSLYDMYSDPGGSGPLWFLRSLLLAALAAARFPLRSRPDVVHVHTSQRYSFVRASFYVLFAKHVWRRPVVLHIHGSSFDEFLEDGSRVLGWLRALVFEAADAVVVLSPYWKDALAGAVPREQLHVVPNAVDAGAYDPSFGADPPHVVFLSNLVERKGIDAFVDAVDELHERTDRPFEVSIAGDGPYADEAEALADRHGNVSYLGYVSEADKRALFEDASVYALPTHAEGLPIAMLESMAGGNAVVSTPVGSIPEVVGPENGVLVEPGDVDDLADALERLVADPEGVERMCRRNRETVVERYSWDLATESLLALYEHVAETGGDAAGDRPREVAGRAADGGDAGRR